MLRDFSIIFALAACCLAQDEKPAPTIPELETASQAAYMKGDYENAHQQLLQAWDLAQMLPPEDTLRYDVLKRLTTVRYAMGEFADADKYLQMAISWREETLGPNDPKTVDDVLLSVAYARGQKDYDRAMAIMSRVLSMHLAINRAAGSPPGEAMTSISVADDFSRMALIDAEMANHDLTKLALAEGALTTALGIRTKILGPLDPSLVFDLDRMGGLQVGLREYGKAEATYRHALVIRETLYGKSDADLIATLDGLAYSLFGEKKYDEAEPVYQRFLELWINSTGDPKHPMVAAALDKIAVFYSAQKKWDEARDALTRANAIRAFLLADGLSNEASEHMDEGKMADAVPVYQHALKVLDPPNPIYDEQRAQIDGMEKELEKVLKKPPSATPLRKK